MHTHTPYNVKQVNEGWCFLHFILRTHPVVIKYDQTLHRRRTVIRGTFYSGMYQQSSNDTQDVAQ